MSRPGGRKAELPIIYEDERIIAVCKPAGLLSVATDRERVKTAYSMMYEYMKRQRKSGRVFVVHRLDRETSGILLLAKDEEIKRTLQDNWDSLVLRRGYSAVVEGRISPPGGEIRSWLKQTRTLLVYSSRRDGDGKLAVTAYRTVRAVDNYSLLDIDLKTGRKNQIRVHMKDLGHPVAGDKKYGAATNPLGRLGLHAGELIIRYPTSGNELRLEAPAPREFEKVF